jgi:catechol 2,3-dioxygenase-like lactoylglutathione lyase family enzyme
MARINKVGHVVLGCRDPQTSIKFYTENLGMATRRSTDTRVGNWSCGRNRSALAQTRRNCLPLGRC